MSRNDSLKQEFFTLFKKKLDEITQGYEKRPFKGIKKETTTVKEFLKDEISDTFNNVLFGEGRTND